VEESIAMFPDRPTERGRRQLESLIRFMKAGATCVVVFVVQRPDASAFRPFHEVDGEFSDLLRQAVTKGLRTCAVATRFIPPQTIRLEGEVPVRL
jgi:sugar fermentation stimulation protein A